jgi:DNA-binding protein H-NS
MRKPNFSKLSNDALNDYKTEIDQLLKARKIEAEKKSKLLKKVKLLVESEGISLDTFFSEAPRTKTKKTAPKKSVRKVDPKYANPKDNAQTWTGRGRKPLWVAAYLKKGGKIEDLAL